MPGRPVGARRRPAPRPPGAGPAPAAAAVLAALLGAAALLAAVGGCGPGGSRTLASWPLDDLQGLLDTDGLSADATLSADGRASIRVDADRARVVRLVEFTPPPGLENRLLVARARMRPVLRNGRAYLQMWVRVPGRDEQPGRDLKLAYARTRDFADAGAQVRLEKGMAPDRVRIDLVIEGIGKVWLDDLRLLAEPLPKADGAGGAAGEAPAGGG